MIVQDVTALPTFNPHGGPITHSSTGSKPDSPVHPCLPKLFLTLGFVCNSRATFLWSVLVSDAILIPVALKPFHTLFQVTNDWLPARNFSWDLLTLLSIFSKVSIRELLSATFPDVIYQIVNLARVRSPGIPLFFFRKYDEDHEGRMTTFSRCPETENWRHQQKGSTTSGRAIKTKKIR